MVRAQGYAATTRRTTRAHCRAERVGLAQVKMAARFGFDDGEDTARPAASVLAIAFGDVAGARRAWGSHIGVAISIYTTTTASTGASTAGLFCHSRRGKLKLADQRDVSAKPSGGRRVLARLERRDPTRPAPVEPRIQQGKFSLTVLRSGSRKRALGKPSTKPAVSSDHWPSSAHDADSPPARFAAGSSVRSATAA